MAIYYQTVIDDRKQIYDAAEKWRNECLLSNKSLIWDGETIWTTDTINRFRTIFIERPDESGSSFDDKLRKQLEGESEDVYKFVIELLYIYYLFPVERSTRYETKLNKLEMVASWKGLELERNLKIFNGLKNGLGTTGTFYNTQKYFEISFLFLVIEKLKGLEIEERKDILSDAIKLKALTEVARKEIGKRVQSQHIVLHLLLPNYFERISSTGNKQLIINSYADYLRDSATSDVDEQLLILREKLEGEYPSETIDFYETPEIAKKWRNKKEVPPERGVEKTPKQYFWVTSNPEIWSVDSIKNGGIVTYSAYNQNGNKRTEFNSFKSAQPGDLVLFYESTPRRQIIAQGEVIQGLHKAPDTEGEVISLKYVKGIGPIDWSEMIQDARLKESSAIRMGARGSLFKLTKEQYEALYNWKGSIEDDDDSLQPDGSVLLPSIDFAVEPLQGELIFESYDVLMEQVTTAIRNGKHIILTGPPGTGKSKLASLICKMYNVENTMVTAASNWSTYETIGGYRPDREGDLYFNEGIFLGCVKEKESYQPLNRWLIIDEINRADIDKAFGSLFSVLTGDEITLPFESENGEKVILKPQGSESKIVPTDHEYIFPNDWRIIATMNTIDKASLYEMSYAFMRRFAFIPVGVPKNITTALIQDYLTVWEMPDYPYIEELMVIWKLINQYRKIGPAIIEDIARHTQDNEEFASAIILYVLPQFEGISIQLIREFVTQVVDATTIIIDLEQLDGFIDDYFDSGAF